MLSQAVEDYLKAIYKLQSQWPVVSTTALADRMGVTPASATSMVKKLAGMKLVDYAPYRGMRLTPLGERAALEVIRHHRLMELYLAQALGMGWDEVDREAERLEHALSEELERRLHEYLGDPKEDPHGDPIPSEDLTLHELRLPSLWEAGPGPVRVRRVSDRDASILRLLSSLGVTPGREVTVLSTDEEAGQCQLDSAGTTVSIAKEVALAVFVEPANSPRPAAQSRPR